MLGCPVPHARGYLECLWEVGYKDGEPLLGDDHDVALAAQYPGADVAKFVAALAECGGPGCAGFIEKAPDGRWMIHHLLENAPSYVQGRIRMRRYREQHRTNTEQCSTVAQPLRNGYASPAPAPAHINTPLTPLAGGNELFAAQEPKTETPKAKRKRKIEQGPPGCERFWAAYPNPAQHRRRVDKDTCIKLWKVNGLEDQADQIVAAVEAAKKTEQWRDQGGKFIPDSTRFLRRNLWEAFADTTKPTVYQPKTYKAPWAEDPVVAKAMALPADQRAELRQRVLDQVPDHDVQTRRFLASRPPEHPELCRRIVALLENAQADDPTMATAQQEGSAKALQAAG
jgi:hypothetical protein